MFSLRQKILISFFLVFLIFLALIFPFASQTVKGIVEQAMEDRANEVIAKIQDSPDDTALIQNLKDAKVMIFFRVSVISDQRHVLYDSHTKRIPSSDLPQDFVVNHPEVLEAFQKGIGIHEDESVLLGQRFYYFAKAFDFHEKTYILRIAVPYKYVADLSRQFELGFLVLSSVVLLLFSIMTWFIIAHLTSPIEQIIKAIKPYQEGSANTISVITIKSLNSSDEFTRLAKTLNSMSSRIQRQINSLTFERNEKEAILDSLIEGVIATDKNMVIAFANNAALKFFNLQPEDFLGHSFSVIPHHQCYTLLDSCRREQRVLTDTIVIKNEKSKTYLDIVAVPKKDRTGVILVLQDNSDHYKMLEMRKDFIANASHELKTPVTIIRGFAETLYDNPDLPQDTVLEITDKIVKNSKRMTNLIKDLLILSDIENLPETRLEECDLQALIESCCASIQDTFPDAEIIIRNQNNKEMTSLADYNLMEMAILNLIENAAKYSPSPASITVDLKHLGKWIEVSVTDKGIGIPASDLGRIFERFYSSNKAHSQKMGGSGLGLSIVENIISKHHGTISVVSKIGQGTTFTLLLPTILRKPLNE